MIKKCRKIASLMGLLTFSLGASYSFAGDNNEVVVLCHSSQEAFREALKTIGRERLEAADSVVVGRLHDAEGQIVGIQSNGPRAFQLRIDYDPQKGPHVNVSTGQGIDRRKFAYTYCSPLSAHSLYCCQLSAIKKIAEREGVPFDYDHLKNKVVANIDLEAHYMGNTYAAILRYFRTVARAEVVRA